MCIHYIYILIYRVLLFGSVFSKSQHCWEAGGPLPITGRIPPKDMILKSSGPSAPPAHFGSRLRCPCPQTPLLVSSPPSQAGEGEGHGNSNKIKHRGTKVELLPPLLHPVQGKAVNKERPAGGGGEASLLPGGRSCPGGTRWVKVTQCPSVIDADNLPASRLLPLQALAFFLLLHNHGRAIGCN